jgi:hypothetical protein
MSTKKKPSPSTVKARLIAIAADIKSGKLIKVDQPDGSAALYDATFALHDPTCDQEQLLFESEFVGEVGVDSGHIEVGDMGDVQLDLPTRLGDGIYSVTAIKVDGTVRGYFINVDALEEWSVTGISGLDKPGPAAMKAARKLSVRERVDAANIVIERLRAKAH